MFRPMAFTVLMALGDLDAAMKEADFILSLTPNSLSTQFFKALILARQNKNWEAQAMLADYGVNGYKLDMEFNGASTYLGGQAGIAWKMSEVFSVSVGGRYVSALNNYRGHMKNIEVNTPLGWMSPGTYLRVAAQGLTGMDSLTAVGTAAALDDLTADQQVEVEQTGSGITEFFPEDLKRIEGIYSGIPALRRPLRYRSI